ncbi:MAG: type I methionyl aminopeptidase [Planctomycetota bacterium]|nr:type I methionyl aminopeptidase [Planctomycetota bacterium]
MPFPTKLRPHETDAAYAAAQKVVETHRRISTFLKPGVTIAEVDSFVAKTLADLGCRSCFLGYRPTRTTPPFPSHSCVSVNDCIVHGTAGSYSKPLGPGDVLKVDVGVTYQGWVGDAAWTYMFAPVAPEVRRLADASKEGLRRGIQTLRPENTFISWAQVVQDYVEKQCGFHLVRGLGGHGYGRRLHDAPFVANSVPQGLSIHNEWPDAFTRCMPGTLVAVEPMVAVGTSQTHQKKNEWPIYTADGSMSVHHEHDVLITEQGPRILTEGMEDLNDVIG